MSRRCQARARDKDESGKQTTEFHDVFPMLLYCKEYGLPVIRPGQSALGTGGWSKLNPRPIAIVVVNPATHALRQAIWRQDIVDDIPVIICISMERTMQVSKWGNSLAVRLPATVVDALGLKEGDQIEIQIAAKHTFAVAKAPGTRELLARLRKFRGRLPATFKFDRLEANERR
jgi:antitoxin MazE